MNRSSRPPQMGSLRTSMMKEKDEELALFLEMRRREKERQNLLLLNNSDEFDASHGSRTGPSPIFNIETTTPAWRTASDGFLESDNDKNDYDWLLTPPGTPLFPSLEMESPKTVMSQLGTPKARPTVVKSRLANPQQEPAPRNTLSSRQPVSSPGLHTSTAGLRRPSSSGGSASRPSTPTGRPSQNSTSKTTLTSTSRSTQTSSSTASTTTSKPSRSATPTSSATLSSTKPVGAPRSSTPPSRSTARSSTPTNRSTLPASKSTSRAATPTRRPISGSSAMNSTGHKIKSPSPSSGTTSSPSVTKPVPPTAKNPVPSRPSSPSLKPKPWKPSDMPGFSLDAPPNLRTTLPDRPLSATRGRPGAPAARSASVEPIPNGRVRRQSCSPSRGRSPNGILHGSGSSVPAMNRLYAKANVNVSPVVMGSKMVERVVNMRKLAPPKQDDKHSPHSNLSTKSSSPESLGIGRTLSKKSLDMAIRHMDIRRSIPGNLRPSMTNIPASSMYSVRSGPTKSQTVNVSDSPLANEQ